jgi:transposase
MYNYEKALEIATYVEAYGIPEAAIHFGIGQETVTRALRRAKQGDDPLSVTGVTHPKVLVFDIETAPILGCVWSLWKQNVGLNQIEKDWFVMSYSAKWLGAPPEEVMYDDMRGEIKTEDDSRLLAGIWKLLDEADIVITQNGKNFDVKKLNARFIIQGFKPPSGFKHIDTCVIAKRIFGFTSNKLEYMTDKLCTTYKKLKHAKFSGFELWKACLMEDLEAWEEMEKYNKWDVLSLEELYYKVAPWDDKHPNFNLYNDEAVTACNRCGSLELVKNGFAYTQVSKFQKFRCKKCGAEFRGRKNLFSKEKRQSLKTNIYNG